MTTLLRVCRNVLRRFFPHLMWLTIACAAAKVWILDPWNSKLEKLSLEVKQLQEALAGKSHEFEALCQKNVQQTLEAALEKEHANTQRLIESAVSTSLAQHVPVAPLSTEPTSKPNSPAAPANWEEAWPVIEGCYKNSQPWAEALPPGNIPEELKRSSPAPKPVQIMASCKDATNVLDNAPAEASSWISSMIRVRRLDTVHQYSANIMELLQKNAWQEALTQLEEHPHHSDPRVKTLIDQLRDRLQYEQAFAQLTTWRQQLCATSAPS